MQVGIFAGVYYCSVCRGFLLPVTFLGDAKTEPIWSCDLCQNQTSDYGVQKILERTGKELSVMKKGSSKVCKLFVRNNETALPKHRFYVTDVKFALAQIIVQEQDGGLPEVSDQDLMLKIDVCKSLSKMTQKLVPTEKRIRGIVLFVLHATIAELRRRKMTMGEPVQLHLAVLQSPEILVDVTQLLKYTPEELPKGKICGQAKKTLKELDLVLKTVHTNSTHIL